MKSNNTHSLYNIGIECAKEYPMFIYADDKSEKEMNLIHNLLESESMNLNNLVKLTYTRRPSLYKSFEESKLNPLLFINKDVTFFGAISETKYIIKGNEEECYYSSDLRVSQKADKKTKIYYRKMYLNVLKKMNRKCFTVVLKENVAALKALASHKEGLYYNPYFEYKASSILCLPTLSFLRSKFQHKEATRDEIDLAQRYIKEYEFSTQFVEDDNQHYIIKKNDKIIAFYSLKRSLYRSMKVKSLNKKVSITYKLANKFFKYKEDKIPWVYISQLLIFDKSYNHQEITKDIIIKNYKNRNLKNGDLVLSCLGDKNQESPKLPTPIFETLGVMYKVDDQEKEYSQINFHLNLSLL